MRTRRIVLIGCAVSLAIAAATLATAAPDNATKCLAAKIKEVGKYEACRYKAEALAVSKNTTPDNSKCESKFAQGWQKAETKYGLDCPTDGDQTTINSTANGHVDDVVETLKNIAPVCGNNAVQAGEVCDGTDLNGETCASQGYDDGTLACQVDCLSLDTSGCANHDCSLLAQDCGLGQGCYPLGNSQLCAGAGSANEGQSCTFANSCQPGIACVDSVCTKICDTNDGVPGCGMSQTCTAVPAWGTDAGACE